MADEPDTIEIPTLEPHAKQPGDANDCCGCWILRIPNPLGVWGSVVAVCNECGEERQLHMRLAEISKPAPPPRPRLRVVTD